jgi:hypothetical protein
MQKKMIRAKILGISLPLVALSMVASAGTYTFDTSSGAKETGGNAVDASAVITTGTGTVSVTLTNLFVNPVTVAQNLSDFSFVLSGSGFGSGTSYTSSGQEVTIDGSGNATTGSTVSTGWLLTSSGGTFTLDDLNGGAGPTHTIIGAPGSGGTYSNANSSIAGNGPHNPFLNQTATFTFNVAGVTTGTTVSAATFSFGTTTGDDVSGCLVGGPSCASVTVPEPISLSLVGGGLLALGLLRKRLPRP